MSKIATTSFILTMALSHFVTSPMMADATTQSPAGVDVKAKFYSAEAVEAIPKLKELKDQNPGFNKILFKLLGFPKNQTIYFEIKRPLIKNADYKRVMTFKITANGDYQMDNGQISQYILGSSRGFLPGERVTFRFISEDGAYEKELSGIPHPAIFRDKKGNVAMRAEILSLNPTVYTIDLPTMREGEEYELKSTGLAETTKTKPKFSKKTPLHYSPAPKTKAQGGNSVLEIKRQSGEVFTLTLPWGAALDIYQQGAKRYPYHN